MAAKHQKRVETRRQWAAGLAVTLTTIVAYMAFWRLSPGLTFVIGCISLVVLLVILYVAGGRVTPDQPED